MKKGEKESGGKYLGDAVYGASDGIVTTFAIVAGVAGAHLSSSVILILGIANLIADGLSMAAGNYLSRKSENEYSKRLLEEEKQGIEKNPLEHKKHIRRIYTYKGFSGKLLDDIVSHYSKDKKQWALEMLDGEYGLHEESANPIKSGFATFSAFVVAGSVPLLSYIAAIAVPALQNYDFLIAFLLTGWALFTVGSLRSKLIAKNWFRAGVEMLVVGGIAASAAYILGAVLGSYF